MPDHDHTAPGLDGVSLNAATQNSISASATRLALEADALRDAAAEFDAIVQKQWSLLMQRSAAYGRALEEARNLGQQISQAVDGVANGLSDPGLDHAASQCSAEWRLALRDEPELLAPGRVLLHMPDHSRELLGLPTEIEAMELEMAASPRR